MEGSSPTKGLKEVLVFVNFLGIIVLALKINQMLRFPVCSVLNLAELLRCSPASGKSRSFAYLLRQGGCQNWDRVVEPVEVSCRGGEVMERARTDTYLVDSMQCVTLQRFLKSNTLDLKKKPGPEKENRAFIQG